MRSQDISYETLLDQINDGVYFIDTNRLITYWNRGAERITGHRRADIVGSVCKGNFLGHLDRAGEPAFGGTSPVLQCLEDGSVREAEVFIVGQGNSRVPVLARISPIHNSRGEVIGAIEVFSDNSTKVAAMRRIQELEELALVCPLTEVGNRRYAELALANAFEEYTRYHWGFGVLFIDIDHFKRVNDTHGHEAGDQVLRMVSHAIKGSLRSFDFIGRWGGEEFIVILPNITDEVLGRVAERCRNTIADSYLQHAGYEIRVTVSIGGAIAVTADTPKGLVDRADRLMYRSKAAGRDRVTIE